MAKRKRDPVVVPSPPIEPRAVAKGGNEPMVLSAPPLGRSGDLEVHEAVHALLQADPRSLGPHVSRIKASFVQDTKGHRSVSLRLDLDEDFPNEPLASLPEKLEALQKAGAARCASVLGAEFRVLSIYFGGKKLR